MSTVRASTELLADDLATVLAVVQQGNQTPEHAAFVQQLHEAET